MWPWCTLHRRVPFTFSLYHKSRRSISRKVRHSPRTGDKPFPQGPAEVFVFLSVWRWLPRVLQARISQQSQKEPACVGGGQKGAGTEFTFTASQLEFTRCCRKGPKPETKGTLVCSSQDAPLQEPLTAAQAISGSGYSCSPAILGTSQSPAVSLCRKEVPSLGGLGMCVCNI